MKEKENALLNAAKELSMGEITYHEFLEVLDASPKEFAATFTNYHYELMRQRKTDELHASLNNLGYLIEQYFPLDENQELSK